MSKAPAGQLDLFATANTPEEPESLETIGVVDLQEDIRHQASERKANNLEYELSCFCGTEEYHRWNSIFRRHVLTDGVKYLADQAGAYWLMDLIASYQCEAHMRRNTFQCWVLKVDLKTQKAVVTCDNGNGKILAEQKIEYTDFPLEEIKLYMIDDGGQYAVILLPNEY
jgi:hypothetical protein